MSPAADSDTPRARCGAERSERPRAPLSCSVRGCAEPLLRVDRSFVCAHGHSFDLARSGYVSLLQPQDRKSLAAGDSRAAVRARSDLVAAGVGLPLVQTLAERVSSLPLQNEWPTIIELGCGAGDLSGRVAEQRSVTAVGIDLSTAAAADAARRFPELTWVVANADRRLPILGASVDLVMSVHARRNPPECHRILRTSGFLLIAVPAANDLIELRELVQGEGVQRDRVPQLIAEHDAWFAAVERTSCTQTCELDRQGLHNVLRGTYRGERLSETPRVQRLEHLTVTFASDIVLFERRGETR